MKFTLDKRLLLFILVSLGFVLGGETIVIFENLDWRWSILIFLVFFFGLAFASHEQEKQHFNKLFEDRPVLKEKEFGEHYFSPERAEIAIRLREILARHTQIDLSRMSPDDRFIEDLKMDDFDSLSTVNFIIEIEKEFGIEIPDSVAEKMINLQNVVDYVAEAIKAKAS